jgi:hypothetical protein
MHLTHATPLNEWTLTDLDLCSPTHILPPWALLSNKMQDAPTAAPPRHSSCLCTPLPAFRVPLPAFGLMSRRCRLHPSAVGSVLKRFLQYIAHASLDRRIRLGLDFSFVICLLTSIPCVSHLLTIGGSRSFKMCIHNVDCYLSRCAKCLEAAASFSIRRFFNDIHL